MASKKSESSYDKALDVVLFKAGSFKVKGEKEGDHTRITVLIRSYNGGEAKISIEESGDRTNGGKWVTGLKRIPVEHMPKIMPLLEKAMAFKAGDKVEPGADEETTEAPKAATKAA